MESKEIAVATNTTNEVVISRQNYSQEQLSLIKKMICKDATDDEFQLFIEICQARGLNPLKREIYFIKYSNKQLPQICVSIDGLRRKAEETGMHAGTGPANWCGEDGKWLDVWTSKTLPCAARRPAFRKGINLPFYGIAHMPEFYVDNPYSKWKTMPIHMLAKCAEAQALRMALPSELGNLYIKDEMEATLDKNNRFPNIYEMEATPEKDNRFSNTIDSNITTREDEIIEPMLPSALKGKGITTLEHLATTNITFQLKNGETKDGWWLLEYFASSPKVTGTMRDKIEKLLASRANKTKVLEIVSEQNSEPTEEKKIQ